MISPPSGYLGLLFPTSSFPNTPIKFHRGFEYKSHSFRGLKRPISALGTLDTDSSSSGSDNSVGSSCSPSSVPIHAKSHPVIQFEPVQSNPRSFLVPNHRKTGSKKTPTTEIGKMRWDCKEMLRKYSKMLQDFVLKGSLKDGKVVQANVIRSGLDPDSHLWTCLVNMYSKFGSFLHAHHLLDEMPEGDVVSWTALIAGFVSKGNGKEGLSSFYDMRKGGILPNGFTFATALKACSLCVALEFGKQLHKEVVKFGYLSDIYVGSALVDLYSKCSEMGLAESVFFFMPELNSVSCYALLHGYARVGNTKMTFSGILKEPQVILTGFDVSTSMEVLIVAFLIWRRVLLRNFIFQFQCIPIYMDQKNKSKQMEGLIPLLYKAIVHYRSGGEAPMEGSWFNDSPSSYSYVRLPAGDSSGRFQSTDIQLFQPDPSPAQLLVVAQSPLHHTTSRRRLVS